MGAGCTGDGVGQAGEDDRVLEIFRRMSGHWTSRVRLEAQSRILWEGRSHGLSPSLSLPMYKLDGDKGEDGLDGLKGLSQL